MSRHTYVPTAAANVLRGRIGLNEVHLDNEAFELEPGQHRAPEPRHSVDVPPEGWHWPAQRSVKNQVEWRRLVNSVTGVEPGRHRRAD